MTLSEKKQQVVEDFSLYDEWLDKYEYLIELGKQLEPFPDSLKTDDRLIHGCQSRVWLDCSVEEGRITFRADSDAIITKGIISLLIGVYSGCSCEEVASDDFAFVTEIGLKENLSPTRANGLASMIARIKEMAQQGAEKSAQDAPQESDNSQEVLTAEDVKALKPYYDNVILALKQVYDPEIPVNIYDLGLIYELNIDKARFVTILMTFTAPNCPMADLVIHEVEVAVKEVPGIEGVKIDLTFEPQWDRSMLSEEARVELGLDYDEDSSLDETKAL